MSQLKQGEEMTDKQKLFCEEYIIDLDATNAAIRAGYDEKSARSTAYHVMEKPAVKEYIRQLMDDRSRKLAITAERVLQELAWIAFARPVDFAVSSETPETAATDKKPSGPANCKVTHVDEATGRSFVFQFSIRYKIQALMALARHLGILPKAGDTMHMPFPNFIFPKKELTT